MNGSKKYVNFSTKCNPRSASARYYAITRILGVFLLPNNHARRLGRFFVPVRLWQAQAHFARHSRLVLRTETHAGNSTALGQQVRILSFSGGIWSNEGVVSLTEGNRYSIDPYSEQSLVHVFLTVAHELTGCCPSLLLSAL
jgi:hypothetical protein